MLEARRITTMLNTGPSLYSVALSLAQSHSLSLSLSLRRSLSLSLSLSAPGKLGLLRNLSASEILMQVFLAQQVASEAGALFTCVTSTKVQSALPAQKYKY